MEALQICQWECRVKVGTHVYMYVPGKVMYVDGGNYILSISKHWKGRRVTMPGRLGGGGRGGTRGGVLGEGGGAGSRREGNGEGGEGEQGGVGYFEKKMEDVFPCSVCQTCSHHITC